MATSAYMGRKHVKVEPARWYYWADRLGLLVWQDMPSTTGIVRVHDAEDMTFTPDEAVQFKAELKAMLDALGNHPSIIVWFPFNEGWGQHETNEILKWVKSYDPSRLVDGPSGWLDRGYGDLYDIHRYPGISMFPPQLNRATVLSEFGGLGLLVNDHLWIADRNWGYQQFDTMDKLQANYGELMRELKPAVQAGLSAAIYTQTTDVEIEVNGLMTYDREVVKFDAAELARRHGELMQPVTMALVPRTILPTSEEAPQAWRYTMTEPGGDWARPEFDDADWLTGNAPFADHSTKQYQSNTNWNDGKIWLRRKFTLDDTNVAHLVMRIHNNDRATVFINGVQVRQEGGHSPDYRWSPLGVAGKQALRQGENVIAVVCEKAQHKAFVDVGLLELKPVIVK
jgi:hypothetical protein